MSSASWMLSSSNRMRSSGFSAVLRSARSRASRSARCTDGTSRNNRVFRTSGPDLERFDRFLFAERARDKDERQIRASIHRKLQCGKTVERRKCVIGENEVNSSVVESGHELGARLHADDFTDEMIRLEELLNELRVHGAILQQQNAEWRRHGAYFMLPGGGSLMIAQKTPSSLIALTNS